MREFALTLSASVVLSVALSLTFTPMLCAKFLKAPEPPKNRIMKGLETGFHGLEKSYARGLDVVMRHKLMTMAVFIGTALLSVVLYMTSSTGFFPQQDTGFIAGGLQTAQDASFATTYAKAREAMTIMTQDPDIAEAHFNIAGNVTNANLNATLRTLDAGRKSTADEVIGRLRPKLARVVGANSGLTSTQDITLGGRAARAQYQYTLVDGDLDELNVWSPQMLQAMQKLPELKDVSSDQQSSAASITLTIDRDAAGRFGIAPADIDSAIYNQIGSRQAAQYFTQLNAYHVVIEAPVNLQATPELFNSIYINSPRTGKPIPLSMLVKVDTSKTRPLSISHQGQLPAATLTFNPVSGGSFGRGHQAGGKGQGRSRRAGEPGGLVPGHGPGLPGKPVLDAGADRGGPAVGLHHPGGAL